MPEYDAPQARQKEDTKTHVSEVIRSTRQPCEFALLLQLLECCWLVATLQQYNRCVQFMLQGEGAEMYVACQSSILTGRRKAVPGSNVNGDANISHLAALVSFSTIVTHSTKAAGETVTGEPRHSLLYANQGPTPPQPLWCCGETTVVDGKGGF